MTSEAHTTLRARPLSGRPEPKPGIVAIEPYKPGRSKAEGIAHPVKLSSNENSLGASPKARAAYLAAADRLNVYPDGRAEGLRAAVAKHYDLEPERLVFGDGTDEVLHLINQLLLEPGDNIVMGEHGFSAYEIGARACQGEVRKVAEPNYRLSVNGLLKAVDERTRLVFITQPGNPTGAFLDRDELAALHQGLPGQVALVIDGAYSDFATDPSFDDGLARARSAENLIVTRTFSKSYGLAALRVGWGYCPAHIADGLDRIRAPFNTSICAQEAAAAALDDHEFFARTVEHVDRWREWLTQQLGGIGIEVVPSQANFVLAGFPTTRGRTAAEADAFLASKGLIVRAVVNYGLPNHLRITIGLEEHNRALVYVLSEFMGR